MDERNTGDPITDALVDQIADILARYPCRADPPLSELDTLRRREVAREIAAISQPNREVAAQCACPVCGGPTCFSSPNGPTACSLECIAKEASHDQ